MLYFVLKLEVIDCWLSMPRIFQNSLKSFISIDTMYSTSIVWGITRERLTGLIIQTKGVLLTWNQGDLCDNYAKNNLFLQLWNDDNHLKLSG